MVAFILSLLTYILLFIVVFKKHLHMAQQNLYNRNKRYMKWFIKDIRKPKEYHITLLFMFLTLLAISILRLNSVLILTIYFFIACFIAYKIFKKENKKSIEKLPLKVTPRIKRLIFTTLLITTLLTFTFFTKYNYLYLSIYYLIYILIIMLIDIIIMFAILINTPIEKLVYYYFRFKAKKKLREMKYLKVIGITGSYGKTSSKNILNEILSIKYNVLPSPKNFNTPNGLMITINEQLTKFDEIFIAEMGAYKKGEIKELCDLVSPKYGILTKIGDAHLESFGSKENIIKTKFELIESLPSDGIGILNGDDENQLKYKLKNKCKIIWIGIDNQDVDIYAKNIKTSSNGMSFDIVFKGDKNIYSFNTKLLGYANVYNILAALALAKEFDLSIDQMIQAVSNIKQIEHRLELKQVGNITYIDDAYNSNPVGSKMALDTLKIMPGKRYVVTPGMIELGAKEYELNKEFGMQIKSSCDIVILVGEKQTRPIYEGLKEEKMNEDNIYIVKDVIEALNIVRKDKDKNIFVLLENDLPDIFNE